MHDLDWMKIGDKVTFNTDEVDAFIAETNSDNKEILRYRELVLAGVNQIGVIKGQTGQLLTVAYPDGWEIPIPAKYLIVLPVI